MGKTHALIYASAPIIFGNEPARPVLEIVAEATDEIAQKVAADYGARRWTSNWREAVEDPNVDVVDIVTPNSMHREMAVAAAAAGKHVYCEKPLGLNADETREMVRAVGDAGVLSLVGHNFPHNPIHAVARDMIRAGELGDIVHATGQLQLRLPRRRGGPLHLAVRPGGGGERDPRRHQRAPLQPHRVPGGADRGGLRANADHRQGARRGRGRLVRERRRHEDGRAADRRHRRLGAHARDVRERLHRRSSTRAGSPTGGRSRSATTSWGGQAPSGGPTTG